MGISLPNPSPTYVSNGDRVNATNLNAAPQDIEANVEAVNNALPKKESIEFVMDGGGSALDTGIKGYLEVPYGCTITQATMLCDQSCSAQIDIWADTYANYPPTDADSICGGNELATSSANKDQDATLTSWTTSLTEGDVLGFNLDSNDNAERITISLKVERSYS